MKLKEQWFRCIKCYKDFKRPCYFVLIDEKQNLFYSDSIKLILKRQRCTIDRHSAEWKLCRKPSKYNKGGK